MRICAITGFMLRSGLCVLLMAGSSSAQSSESAGESSPLPAADSRGGPQAPAAASVVCASTNSERRHCAADTSAGVALTRSTGSGSCLLGKTWGYDDTGVWVSDNCGGEFTLGQGAVAATSQAAAPPTGATPTPKVQPPDRIETLGRVRPWPGIPGRPEQRRRTRNQRLRPDSLHQPDARHADVHGPSGHRAHGGRPQRPVPAPNHGLLQGLDRHSEAHLQHLLLDREPNGPEEHLREHGLPVLASLQPVCRPQRAARDAFAAGLAPLLARARPRDGRRVLPAVLLERHLGAGRGHPGTLVQRHGRQQPERAWLQGDATGPEMGHRRLDVVDADDDRSSARAARTAIGRRTRRSPPGSASPRSYSP